MTFFAGDRIDSPQVSATGTNVVLYIWVLPSGSSFDCILYNNTATASIQEKTIDATDSGNVSDKSHLLPFAGGISKATKKTEEDDSDRVKPKFTKDLQEIRQGDAPIRR